MAAKARTKTMTGLQRLRVESVHIEITRFLKFTVQAEELDEIKMLSAFEARCERMINPTAAGSKFGSISSGSLNAPN